MGGRGFGDMVIEIQVETPQSILGADGTALVARMVHAGDGRVTGLHYGTYDYSASIGVATYPQHGRTPTELIAASDGALYTVKRDGGHDAAVAAEAVA